MKKIILALGIFTASVAVAQTKEIFLDWNFRRCPKERAQFVSIRTQTDSGWLRNDFYFTGKHPLQMAGLYKDSDCKIEHGWFTYFYPNKKIAATGRFINDKRDGLWLQYHYNGMMSDSMLYEAGQPKGTALRWHRNGFIADSTVFNADGSAVHVSWFDNGQPSHYGRMINNKQEGKWQYFSIKGFKAATEEYADGKLVSRIYYDAGGNALADTANRDKPAIFGAAVKDWQEYVYKNLMFPTGYKLVNIETVTVVISAVVNEDGSVTDAFVQVPFDDVFDKEALRMFTKPPRWVAAVQFNRKVKTIIRQPVTFSQKSE